MSSNRDVVIEGIRAAEGLLNLAGEEIKVSGYTKLSELLYHTVGKILGDISDGIFTERKNSVVWILHTAFHEYADGDLGDTDLASILLVYKGVFSVSGDNPVDRYIGAFIPDEHLPSDEFVGQMVGLAEDGDGEMVSGTPFVGVSDQNPMSEGLPTSPGLLGFIITTKSRA